jgi:hypothetical protein
MYHLSLVGGATPTTAENPMNKIKNIQRKLLIFFKNSEIN